MNDLEIRVRRLEQLHIWGSVAIVLLGMGYFVMHKKVKK